ncbi:MAG: nucleotide sugar dehydrogenase [bacterium]|nr:nucleotide sugar dehydrogenase [bacterium]
MGYVGLPLMQTFCEGGLNVLGLDVDPAKVRMLNAGKSYIDHIPSKLIRDCLKAKQFSATTDPRKLQRCDAVVICVPTPLTKMREPDMTYVRSTAEVISRNLRRGQLVVLESTTYPGTTREVVLPILEQSGLKAGKDFYLAFSPEREDPGNKNFSTRTIPKVVGGIDRTSSRVACALYSRAVEQVVSVSSCEAAEACKILENVYRCINIAMINEIKMLFHRMGIDVWEVIRAASTKPFGFHAFYPGPGLGGHCIPIDPFYLTWKAREFDLSTRFIELAGDINARMPEYVIDRVGECLNRTKKAINGSKILVLGLAYKKDIDDLRESPSIELIELLRERGAKVDYNDPYIPHTHKQREHDLGMRSKPLSPAMLGRYDCVLIATDHSDYDYAMIVKHARAVVDTRNATSGVRTGRSKIFPA